MDDPVVVVWEAIDRLGRIVRMSQPAWRHVVDRHAELGGQEHVIPEVAVRADVIVFDRNVANREIHRREGRRNRPATVVVVHHRPMPEGWIGSVVTAFYRTGSEKGSQRWP